ncbi:DUF6950 family protein [Sphingomonas hengshuiensis]|uniref:DUF6950 domain-containing protein n=1 Tax=Sphingomonas hengshuiensis TaxID=1609977 RepID=A0A7U5BFS9_9SPHN|nr:hypothetical protein [Sphingomonas hengshuiensis]AJP74453.1 hypothetical protein TS85_11395 [Sphingomonas hengshuiensis]
MPGTATGQTPGWDDHCGDGWRAHVLAATGRDVCAIVGPSPRSPRQWAATMRRLGVRGLGGVVSAVHGASIPLRQARRGDVVRRGWALGVCRGELSAFHGGVMIPTRDADEAWRVEGWGGDHG